MSKTQGKSWVQISNVSEEWVSASLDNQDVESIDIKRDTRDGKNLITVKINDKLVFSFDSNFKGEYGIKNNIQMPLEDLWK